MNTSSIPGAADSASPEAALLTSTTLASGVQETPDVPATDLQIAPATGASSPTIVIAKPIAPLPDLPHSIGLQARQRLALQALAAGNSVYAAARHAGVNPSTLFRWRRRDARFIAAFNAWQAHSQQAARDCLIAANEHAARTILRAAQTGHVQASLAVLKGMGTLAPQKIGPEFARAVALKLSSESDKIKSEMGGDTREMRQRRAKRKLNEKKAATEAENRKKAFDRHMQIPPLPRPITLEAIEQSVKAYGHLADIYAKACSITITAATGDHKPLLALLTKWDQATGEEAQRQLNSPPKLLTNMVLWDHAERIAQQFEALGAAVELRPGWRI
jgi:hypothetical protein